MNFDDRYEKEIIENTLNILDRFEYLDATSTLHKILDVTAPMQEMCTFQQAMSQLICLFEDFIEDPYDKILAATELLLINAGEGFYKVYHFTHKENQTGTLGIRSCIEYETTASDVFEPPELEEIPYPVDWDSLVFKKTKYDAPKQDTDTIHYLQSIEFKLDPDVVILEDEVIKDSYRDLSTVKNLTSKEIKKINLQREVDRNFIKETEEICFSYLKETFRFKWKYDSRGRIYSSGYHINPQGSSYKKACLNLATEYHII